MLRYKLYPFVLIFCLILFIITESSAKERAKRVRASTSESPKSEKAIPPKAAKKISTQKKQITREQVNDLKQAVLNSKTQLILLKHMLRNESVSKSYPEVNIAFKNDMGSRYRLHSVRYQIDGTDVYTYFRDEEAVATNSQAKKIDSYVGALAPGNHTLFVSVVFQGNDSGVFSYISDYKTKTEGRISFELERGKKTKIEVVAFEKGWILTQFKDRPDLQVKINGESSDEFIRY